MEMYVCRCGREGMSMLKSGILKNKRHLLLVCLMACMMFGLIGCSKYPSSFSTVLCVSNNDSNSAFINFSSFEGTKSFKLKCKNEDGGILKYSAELEEGSAIIYVDVANSKEELCHVSAGEKVEDTMELAGKGTIYIILESEVKCKGGKFDFEIENK